MTPLARASLLTALLVSSVAAACYSGPATGTQTADPTDPQGPSDMAGGGEPGASTNAADLKGLPCDVAAFLAANCTSCHGTTLRGNAPMPLTSFEALADHPDDDATTNYAKLSAERIHDTKSPMPPGRLLSGADTAVFDKWVAAGMPRGECSSTSHGDGPDGGVTNPDAGVTDPYDTPVVCTSKTTATARSGATMRPGEACIACHSAGRGPTLAIAGTVFPTAHEPDDCNGARSIQVLITGADGKTTTVTSNSAGSFTSTASIAMPYTAKVVSGGRTRAMATPQTSGDCNSCHTESGKSGAPGRIMAP